MPGETHDTDDKALELTDQAEETVAASEGDKTATSSVIRTDQGDLPADFKPWSEEPLPAETGSAAGRQTILKSRRLRRGVARRITPAIPPPSEPEPMEVEPMTEGGRIVGLKITCHCGASHEVRFEFGEQS